MLLAEQDTERGPFAYRLYGVRIQSHWPLPCSGYGTSEPGLGEVELREEEALGFAPAAALASGNEESARWFLEAPLAGGDHYLKWSNLFEFLVSADGRRIACRALGEASWEAFHTYLLGQVLSFALIKQGIEPLHCTAVVVNGGAVGFLGDCGYGKSSLAAAFIRAGYPVLTDDLLVLNDRPQGYLAYPGFPRLKLFPQIAQALLGEGAGGARMNPFTQKLIIPLGPEQSCQAAVPLQAFFVLKPPRPGLPRKRITLRSLSPRQAFIALTTNTFNARIKEPDRLSRLFAFAGGVAARVPVKSLSYPRNLDLLPQVVAAVRANLAK